MDTAEQAQEEVRELRRRIPQLSADGLDLLFRNAHTHNAWLDQPVDDSQFEAIYDLMKMAPTSANCCPARLVFLRTAEAKERLRPALSKKNTPKTMASPVVVLFAYDLRFHERLDFLAPHQPGAAAWFTSSPALAEETAFRNGTLQAAYFMLAARAVGLDAGPMSGFNKDMVDAEFFAGTSLKCNFICSLGHGDPAGVAARLPRLPFRETCRVL